MIWSLKWLRYGCLIHVCLIVFIFDVLSGKDIFNFSFYFVFVKR